MLFLSLLLVGLSLVGYVSFSMLPAPTAAVAVPAPQAPMDSVLVAARPISTGMLLRAEDLRWEAWPPGRLVDGYMVRGRVAESAYSGAVTRRSFAAGEPIMAGHIVAPGERGFLAAVLSPGSRAVSVAVDAVSATGGLIWPGDRVDLILTQNFEAQAGRDLRSRAVGETVLQNLRVIAIDQQLGEAGMAKSGPDGRIPRTVTLEVTARQSETVTVAATMGKLSLALRSLLADETVLAAGDAEPAPTWAEDVSPALRQLPAPHSAEAPATRRPALLIIRGSKTETLER
ncbi:Flp pilus assembly protein CpaB (plasmid) [Azospirillum brasilense]|uniref:Flp pilus assembly protein CpaB n=1 Tax=Azospirillum brasilense TaxID=192 RepID=A0A235H8A7_AZOBR|nr:Flp pilus assembly protein CpaB [Azospirillum brasilense]